ncbi:MAG: S8 family serine peptidase [Alphaproteobacteria bacterium]|nr:S8 family serine peptidase [Alphaproteobacteria bacterium]
MITRTAKLKAGAGAAALLVLCGCGGGGGGVASSLPPAPINKETEARLVYGGGVTLPRSGGADITVGVVDVGYGSENGRHPDLPSHRITFHEGGLNKRLDSVPSIGGYWHGLAVAGVIAARSGGGYSVGVAPSSSIAYVNIDSFAEEENRGFNDLRIRRPAGSEGTRLAGRYFNEERGIVPVKEVDGIRDAFLDAGKNLKTPNLEVVNFSYIYLGPQAFLHSKIAGYCTLISGARDPGCAGVGTGKQSAIAGIATAFDTEYERLVRGDSSKSAEMKFAGLKSLIEYLGDAGVVSVVALGNYRREAWLAAPGDARSVYDVVAPSDVYPAVFAGGDIGESLVAVGALEGIGESWDKITEWRQAFYSNGCGAELKARCIFAPVTRYETASDSEPDEYLPLLTLNRNRLLEGAFGTSFAAPQVSGAIALIVKQFSDTMGGYDAKQAANRLLDTAALVEDGTGAQCRKGTMAVECRGMDNSNVANLPDGTGNGRMRINEALQPVGDTATTTATSLSDTRIPLEGSVWRGGTPLGDAALRVRETLAESIVIDELNHAFAGELSRRVSATPPLSSAAILLAPSSVARTELATRADTGAQVKLRLSPQMNELVGAGPRRDTRGAGLFPANPLGVAEIVNAPEVAVGIRGAGGENRGGESLPSRTVWLGLADTGMRQNARADTDGGRSLLRLGGTEKVGRNSRLHWEIGRLGEETHVLGGASDGALGRGGGARTRLVRLGLDSRAGGWRVFADSVAAEVRAAGGGVLREWRGLRARGWSLGATRADGGFGVRLSQPLRVRRGTLRVDYPVRVLADGETVERRAADVSLVPSGRELRLEAAAARTLARGATVEVRLLWRRDPGHRADARAVVGGSAGFRLRF